MFNFLEHSSKSSELELYWSAYKPVAFPQSSPKFSHQTRPSTSSLPPVDTTLSPPSPPLGSTDSTPPSPFAYMSPVETRRRYTPPPTPPLVKLSSKKTFPTTPPPQRRNKLHPEAFQPLTKSKSHESQLSVKVNQDVDLSKLVRLFAIYFLGKFCDSEVSSIFFNRNTLAPESIMKLCLYYAV